MTQIVSTRPAVPGTLRAGTAAAAFMVPVRRRYRRSETGTANGARNPIAEHRSAAAMPHHMNAVTSGAATIEAKAPIRDRLPNTPITTGAVAA